MSLTTLLLSCLGPWKGPILSVRQNVKMSKKYYPEYGPVIHPVEVATRKSRGNGNFHAASLSSVEIPRCLPFKCWSPTLPTFQVLKSHAALPFDVFTGIIVFINLPVPFHWKDDKYGIGMVIRVLYNFSKPAVTAVSYPIRAGKFSNSPVPIPDWIVCAAGQFNPLTQAWRLYGVLRAVCTNLSAGNTRSADTALCTCFDAPVIKTSINRYNPIATPKIAYSPRQENKYVNYEMKACGIVIKDPLQGPNFQFLKPIYRKSLLHNCM